MFAVGEKTAENPQGNSSATSQRSAAQFGSELDLERAIEAAKQQMCAAPERADKLRHWREMCRLIDQRTPERMRFMARVRGLE